MQWDHSRKRCTLLATLFLILTTSRCYENICSRTRCGTFQSAPCISAATSES